MKYALWARKHLGTTVPQDENLPIFCPIGTLTTHVPHPGASTLISAPWSKHLDN